MNFNINRISRTLKKFGVNLNYVNGTKTNTDQISTIQTCARILIENVSRLPVFVKDKQGQTIENHKISRLFNRSFSPFLTADKGRKTLERDRVLEGNGFAIINYDEKGNLKSLTPVVYEAVSGIVLKDNQLFYAINHNVNPFSEETKAGLVSGDNMLHFTSSIIKEFVGISPVKSLMFEAGIRQKASETLMNFYRNNAMNPTVLSSNIADLSQIKALKEFAENFELENTGSSNAGKVIKLPPGFKLETLNYKLADAELISTLKFTNQEIISAFGVPSFLMSYETTQSIENQTLEFKTFTLQAILAGHKAELENKLLTTKELEEGCYIDFDYSVLLDADLVTKANAYRTLVTNGLCTPNEAILKMGFKPIEGEGGNKHYMQAQYIDLETKLNKTIENE